MSAEVHFEANKIMAKRYGASRVFEGVTYFPAIVDEREALDRLMEAVEKAGYEDIFMISMDCAASHRYDRDEERYVIGKKVMTKDEMINFYKDLAEDYPIFSLEDPLHQDDFEGHAELTKELGIQIVGDDLFVTSMTRLRKGMETKAANALLLKPNQIGTLTETLDTARFAMRNGLRVVVSGRQGLDEEDLIPDITVALNAGQVKIGPLSSRRAKYNRLLRMEEELGEGGRYPRRETLIK
jgi:enolase